MLYQIIRFIIMLPITIFFPTRVSGRRNIPKKGRVILVCNHLSMTDIFILSVVCPRSIYYLAKSELFKYKISAYLLTKVHAFPVNRGIADLSAIKKSIEVLNDDKVLGIFPEGTTKGNKESPISVKQGTALIAVRGKANIVPAAFKRKPKLFRPNALVIGEMFNLEEYFTKRPSPEVLDEISDRLMVIMNDLRDNA